jgi:DNA-binding MarR family transcriptional regulator
MTHSMPQIRSIRQPTDAEAFRGLVADVYDAADVLRSMTGRIAARSGQTQARWQLMSAVTEGDWTVPMVADRLGTSRQAVQRIANELADEGLAVFEANRRRQRSPFLRLTSRGRAKLGVLTAMVEAGYAEIIPRLEGVDVVELRSSLQKLTRTVRGQPRRHELRWKERAAQAILDQRGPE